MFSFSLLIAPPKNPPNPPTDPLYSHNYTNHLRVATSQKKIHVYLEGSLNSSSLGGEMTGGHGGGGHKAVLAISEDNESAVIKYRSEQDMASICEY